MRHNSLQLPMVTPLQPLTISTIQALETVEKSLDCSIQRALLYLNLAYAELRCNEHKLSCDAIALAQRLVRHGDIS